MADRVRAHDWASTPIGPISAWSRELVMIVNLTLSSASPARTMWGPEFILIYNDAYRPIPGPRHPEAFGKPARLVYQESWHVVGPLLDRAIASGETLFYEKLLVPLPTEAGIKDFYLNYSFNPVYEDGKIAGLFGSVHDVTGQVMATRQLQESEARALRILRSIGDAVIVTDADIRVTHINPVAEKLTGWARKDAIGTPLSDIFRIVNETTRKTVESPAEKVKALGVAVGLANHTVLIARNGTEAAIDDSGAPVTDDDGNLLGIVLVFRDIGDKRRAEREKDHLTRRLQQVLEVTSDAVVSLDRNWVITYLNPMGIKIYSTGRTVLGRNIWEAFPDARYPGSPYVEFFQRAMDEGRPGTFEAHYPEPLNAWLRIEVLPTEDGIVLFSRGITKKKADREILRLKSEEAERQRIEIETVYRTAPIGLALFDTKDFRYLRLNDRQAEFFGMKPEQIVGRTVTEMAPIEGLKDLFNQVAAGNPVVNFPLEGSLVTSPSEHRYWTVSYFPVVAADGSIQAITAASLEVTQQKKTEKALIQSEKLAVAGRFAASIAHEINNPLEAVTNLLFLAQLTDDSNQVKGYLEAAERELRRVAAIANQTLRFHKQLTHPRQIACSDLIASVLSVYESRLANSGIQVQQRIQTDSGVLCFEGEIRQVLSNLVSNALDAMHHPGDCLLLRTRKSTNWKTGQHGVTFTVADTGVGIKPASLGKIFDAFYTTKDMGGTGLGLWVSADIVNRHGGSLRVRTAYGKEITGTVFTMFLPLDFQTR
jgi:PAS domain S-box-containing protein